MASVVGKTSIKIDDLINDTIVSGAINPSGHLILTNRGGDELDAGILIPPFSTPWLASTAYKTSDVVGYAGFIWKAILDNLNKPPALFTTSWVRLTGRPSNEWVELDAYFTGDDPGESWQFFWKYGTVVRDMSTTAGEFESGIQSLRLLLSPSSGQHVHIKEENIVHGGAVITTTVRAKLATAAVGATLSAQLFQNDTTGAPSFFATGVVQTAATEGAQTLTTSWQTFTFTTTAVAAKPRATVAVTAATAAAGATVLIDRITTSRLVAVSSGASYATTLATGTITAGVEKVVTHSLGSTDVLVGLRNLTTGFELTTDIRVINTTQIGLTFAAAPTYDVRVLVKPL